MAAVEIARPLAGKLIVITRPKAQAASFATLLEAAGARVLVAPTIVIAPPPSWAPLDDALRRAREYDWAVFTSVNGVEMVKARLSALGLGAGTFGHCRIAAIGPATAEALSAMGLKTVVVPDEYVAEELARALAVLVRSGQRILLARAAETRDLLVRELERLGTRVEEVAAYRTRPASEDMTELKKALGARKVDAVTFTSSSTVRHFVSLFAPAELERVMAGVDVACIGPITRATAADAGLRPSIMAEEYTIAGLAAALQKHYTSKGAPRDSGGAE
jgi:uroporphyrinogen III methyltransferase/synthase